MPTYFSQESAAPRPAIVISKDAKGPEAAHISSRQQWPSRPPSRDISSIFETGNRGSHATLYHHDGFGRSIGPCQRRYRSDHPEAISQDDQADRAPRRLVLRLAQAERRFTGPDIFFESTALPWRDDPSDTG